MLFSPYTSIIIYLISTLIHTSPNLKTISFYNQSSRILFASLNQELFSDYSDLSKSNNTRLIQSNLKIYTFFKNFSTRSDLCYYKCSTTYNIICFFQYACFIQIRNFTVVAVLPILFSIICGVCFGKKWWSYSCWYRYISIIFGIRLFGWILNWIRQNLKKNKEDKTRGKKKQKKSNEIKDDKKKIDKTRKQQQIIQKRSKKDRRQERYMESERNLKQNRSIKQYQSKKRINSNKINRSIKNKQGYKQTSVKCYSTKTKNKNIKQKQEIINHHKNSYKYTSKSLQNLSLNKQDLKIRQIINQRNKINLKNKLQTDFQTYSVKNTRHQNSPDTSYDQI